jgi:hypothetical protein
MGHTEVYQSFITIANLPWMCIGDFNEVLHQHEHQGVLDWSLSQIEGFREALDVCELADLGYEGNKWTFEKRVAGGQGSGYDAME